MAKTKDSSQDTFRVSAERADKEIDNPLTILRELDKMLKSDNRLYVRNMTDELEGSILGNVHVTFMESGTNKPVPIVIPAVKFPICISDKVAPESLRRSQDLRRVLEAGMLSLIPESVAEAEMQDPEVADEMRDYMRANSTKRKNARAGAYKQDAEVDTFSIENENVNARVIAVTAQLKTKEISSKSALRALKAIASTFTEEDLGYMLAMMSDASVRKWVEKQTPAVSSD